MPFWKAGKNDDQVLEELKETQKQNADEFVKEQAYSQKAKKPSLTVDNDFTPQLSVLAEPEDYRVIVPSNYVTNNEIVLNISPTACDSLQLGNDVITFKARFAGKVESISIPVDRVKAIFIREEGYGMRFDVEPMKKPKMSGDQPKRGFVKVED